ncbi:hypothetical protein H5410_036298 [Solanum commersonii]|uniref:PB1-like domain-containing protein n=1 Tax=Solanum commersonii TaxID=4109 RepID=A0A9J5Y4Y6_SOLCO|nr:hypothetical protein H5410_036298 [Solanum commersonii]
MDVYVTLRFHHGGKLQQKLRIKYEGGIVTDCFDVDVDKLSYFEFVDIVKEIGYNCSACVVYIEPPKCRRVVEVKSDRDIMDIVHQLKHGDVVELYVTHLVEEVVVPEIGYLNDVGGESNATFDKESSQTFEGSEGLGFEEATQPAQPEEPIVGEELGRTSASVGEDLGRASAGVGEDLGRAFVSVGEDLGGTSFAAAAFDIPEVGSHWESETEASDDSDNADLSDEGEDEYGSDVHEEGHNKRGCHLNNQANTSRGRGKGRGCETSSTRSSVGSFRAPTESQSSTKRERGRPRGSTKQASATGRGRGTSIGNGTWIGVAADGSGATGRGRGTGLAGRGRGTATGVAGRGRGTGVAATATDVPGATGGGKRPRMDGMGLLHTQSGFTIHNPGMPMKSSIVTGNLGHHKPRSGLKWKGKTVVTQQGLQETRENKRMRTRSNAAEV